MKCLKNKLFFTLIVIYCLTGCISSKKKDPYYAKGVEYYAKKDKKKVVYYHYSDSLSGFDKALLMSAKISVEGSNKYFRIENVRKSGYYSRLVYVTSTSSDPMASGMKSHSFPAYVSITFSSSNEEPIEPFYYPQSIIDALEKKYTFESKKIAKKFFKEREKRIEKEDIYLNDLISKDVFLARFSIVKEETRNSGIKEFLIKCANIEKGQSKKYLKMLDSNFDMERVAISFQSGKTTDFAKLDFKINQKGNPIFLYLTYKFVDKTDSGADFIEVSKIRDGVQVLDSQK